MKTRVRRRTSARAGRGASAAPSQDEAPPIDWSGIDEASGEERNAHGGLGIVRRARHPTPVSGRLVGLRDWPRSVVRWLFGGGDEDREPESSPRSVARFQNICISREAGAGGGAIARMVGQRLGWKVYDHELLEAIAHRMEVPIDEVRAFDELAPSVVQDWLLPLREEYYAPQEAYLDHLAKLIEAIGRAGESIIVGRGAGFMLPRETTLSVRIIAPLQGPGAPAGRADGRLGPHRPPRRPRPRPPPDPVRPHDAPGDSTDPHNYDLVLDSHSLGLEIAAEVIVRAVEAGRPGVDRPGASPWTMTLGGSAAVGPEARVPGEGDSPRILSCRPPTLDSGPAVAARGPDGLKLRAIPSRTSDRGRSRQA